MSQYQQPACVIPPRVCHQCTCDGMFSSICIDKIIRGNPNPNFYWLIQDSYGEKKKSMKEKISILDNELKMLKNSHYVPNYWHIEGSFICNTCNGNIINNSNSYNRIKAEIDAVIEKKNKETHESNIKLSEAKIGELRMVQFELDNQQSKKHWWG